MPVETFSGPAGEIIHIVSQPPPALPDVARRDLELAWEAAGAAPIPAATRVFHFPNPPSAPVELRVTDADAAAWVAALERERGISNLYNVSLCLRFLALVALMAQAGWAREWFALDRAGATLRPELLQAAALVRLNATGDFDETALRALLPAPWSAKSE